MQFDALRAEHPNPQFARKQWVDMTGEWSFAYDDANLGLSERWWNRTGDFEKTICVPFPPESSASGIGDTSPHPVVWYRRTFKVLDGYEKSCWILHFGAVDYRAHVWVNGQLVATHEGGMTPFEADVTAALSSDSSEQIVVVRAEDEPRDLAQPRGKQDWRDQSHIIWYDRTTGIWQPVWLEPAGQTHIDEIRWTPDADIGLLSLETKLNHRPARPLHLRLRLWLRDKLLCDDVYTMSEQVDRRDVLIHSHDVNRTAELLWSPKYPNLVEAQLTLLDGDHVLDDLHSYAALRSVGFADGRFMLNGSPYYLRMVLEQGYWPESHLAAPGGEALKREVELIKSLGFNGARIHQKVEDPRFLYWCDRLGLLVWGEMANAYVFTNDAAERLTREWLQVLKRDYNHPCIITWVPLNESWGVPALRRDQSQQDFVRALYYLTHTLDRTRPVIGNDGWEHVASDFWGVHDYAPVGATLHERYGSSDAVEQTIRTVQPHYHTILLTDQRKHGEPLILTECGGISYAPIHGKPWYGYGTVQDQGAYLAKYKELITAILDSPAIAGFCYTQLTDTQQETNGLLDAQRKPKLPVDEIYAINTRYSKAVPGELLQSAQLASGSVDTIS